jgi:hypothetical protein
MANSARRSWPLTIKLCLDNNYSRDIVNTTGMNYFKTENMHYAFKFSYRSKTCSTISTRTGEWSVKKTILTFCFKLQVSSNHVRGICILTRTATITVYKKNWATATAVVWVTYQSYVEFKKISSIFFYLSITHRFSLSACSMLRYSHVQTVVLRVVSLFSEIGWHRRVGRMWCQRLYS